MDKETLQPMESFPVSFRVICVGKELSGVYRSIISMGFDDVLVQTTTMSPNPTPSESDKLVILLANGKSPLLESIARSFYQAGVLTLIVSTELIETKGTICDAQTGTSIESMPLIVKDLLNPLLKEGVLCYDFNDLYEMFHNSGRFKVLESSSRMKENRIKDAIIKMSEMVEYDEFNLVDRISLIIFINNEIKPKLEMSEIQPLSEYFNTVPNEIDIVWSINFDKDMPTDEVNIVTVLSGKNLEL